MKLLSVFLKNWCQHENLEIDMDAPVFGFLGPNGAGKSNILAGIRFAFTGYLKKNQLEYVRKTHIGEPPSNGSVTQRFLKDGIVGEIFRQVGKSPKRRLTWDGVVYEKAADIDRILEELLACDKDAISTVVFLSQGEIGGMLFQTPAVREAKLADMLLVSYMQGISDIVGQKKQELDRSVVDQSSVRDEAMEARQAAFDRNAVAANEFNETLDVSPLIASLTRGYNSWKATLSSESETDRAQGRINELMERESFLKLPEFPAPYTQEVLEGMVRTHADYHQRRSRHVELVGRLHKVQTAQAQLKIDQARQAELIPVAMELSEAKEERTTLTGRKNALIVMSNYGNTRAELESRIEKAGPMIAEKEIELENANKEIPEVLAESQRINEEIHKLNAKMGLVQAAQSVESGGCCPLCRSAIAPDAIDKLYSLPDMRQEKDMLFASLDRAAQKSRQLGDKINNLQRQLGTWGGELATLKQQLQAMVPPEGMLTADAITNESTTITTRLATLELILKKADPSGEMQTLTNSIRNLQYNISSESPESELILTMQQADPGPPDELLALKIEQLRAYLLQRAALDKEIESARGGLKAAQERLDAARAEDTLAWNALQPSGYTKPAEPTIVQNELSGLQQKMARREQLRGAMEATSKALGDADLRVKEIEGRIDRNRRTVELAVQLEKLRDAFGRGGIPRNYLIQVYAMLVESTQVNLGLWEADFQIDLDMETLFNLKFWRTTDPETKFDQDLLSGGQRIRLAISFVMAIQQLVIPDLNFLVLDEPSTHLDTAGVEALQALIITMAHSLQDSEAQVIVVDHNPLLERAFPKSLRLVAPGEDKPAYQEATLV